MQKRYYRVDEVAKMFTVSYSTVRKWCMNGEIECNNVGGIWFIPVEAVEPYREGIKPKRVQMLEKENERLRERIKALQNKMLSVAGTLLQEGELNA